MRTLVIGASGFLGRSVTRELAVRGHDVVGTSRSGNGCVPLDVTDARACSDLLTHGRFDSVINLAASGVTSGTATDLEMRSVNSTGALVLARALAELAAPPWFLHLSSSTEPRHGGVGESPYSVSKAKGTAAAELQLRESGLAHAIVRVHNTYGPGQPPGRFVMSAVLRLRDRVPLALRHPRRIRDFCFSADVVDHLVDLLEHPEPGAVHREIGTGRGLSLEAAAGVVCACVGAPPDLVVCGSGPSRDAHAVQVADSSSAGFLACTTPFDVGVAAVVSDLTRSRTHAGGPAARGARDMLNQL